MDIQEQSARYFTELLKNMAVIARRPEFACVNRKLNSRGFGVLCILGDNPQPVTMTNLAEQAGISSQQLTRLINEMEERKLVRRTHNQDNRRLVYVNITEEGKWLREEEEKRILRCMEQLLGSLKREDQIRLHESIQCLLEILGQI